MKVGFELDESPYVYPQGGCRLVHHEPIKTMTWEMGFVTYYCRADLKG